MCQQGHSYDLARSGYVNLLQPQDRRSAHAGDAKAAVAARARLFDAGIGRHLIDVLLRLTAALPFGEDEVIVDLGSGGGDALAALAETRAFAGIGIDLSTAAVEHAARRYPGLTWVVANADRRLPLLDHSVAGILSLHGRRAPAECARVLTPEGFLIIAVPAPDDLIELRAIVQGEGSERDRGSIVLAEHSQHFALVDRVTARASHRLDRDALLDLLRGTYRGERTSAAARVESLTSLEVTLASEFFVFSKSS